MATPEQQTRLVVAIEHDARDSCPVAIGDATNVVLATWLIGAEGRVTDVSPALGPGERERGPFLQALERAIGSLAARINAEPMLGASFRAPRRGADARDLHFQNHGRLDGLCDAYRMLTGLPQATAIRRGLEVWRECQEQWEAE